MALDINAYKQLLNIKNQAYKNDNERKLLSAQTQELQTQLQAANNKPNVPTPMNRGSLSQPRQGNKAGWVQQNNIGGLRQTAGVPSVASNVTNSRGINPPLVQPTRYTYNPIPGQTGTANIPIPARTLSPGHSKSKEVKDSLVDNAPKFKAPDRKMNQSLKDWKEEYKTAKKEYNDLYNKETRKTNEITRKENLAKQKTEESRQYSEQREAARDAKKTKKKEDESKSIVYYNKATGVFTDIQGNKLDKVPKNSVIKDRMSFEDLPEVAEKKPESVGKLNPKRLLPGYAYYDDKREIITNPAGQKAYLNPDGTIEVIK